MGEYRVYAVDTTGHIVRRFEFEASDDRAAMSEAHEHLDGLDVEVWEHKRVVGKLFSPTKQKRGT